VHFKIVPYISLKIGEGKVLRKGFEMHPTEISLKYFGIVTP